MIQKNISVLKTIYSGESKRDATSKIRGFLFQDILAIEELLDEKTEFICSEYIEDVMVVRKETDASESVRVLQSKYYPKSNVKMNEVARDLYYQYLRLKHSKCSAKVKPILVIHSSNIPTKPTLKDMQSKEYTKIDRDKKPDLPQNFDIFLENEVYTLGKQESEDKLFEAVSYDGYINEFLECLEIVSDKGNLDKYREQIADSLEKVINITECAITDSKIRKKILLGLAVQYIHKTYTEHAKSEDNIFEQRKCERDNFIKYLQKTVSSETDESISAYLRVVTMECYGEIEELNPELSQDELETLQYMRDTTADWIIRLCGKSEGQIQLLNTISTDKIDGYMEETLMERLTIMKEHSGQIVIFLNYIWKILINENQELIGQHLTMEDKQRLRIDNYLDPVEKRYLKFNFPNDPSDAAVVISELSGARYNRDLMYVFNRMTKYQPTKWYLQGQCRGIYAYTQNVSEICNKQTVSTLHPNHFSIECMKCIQVDMGNWYIHEDCKETIFSEECIQDKEENK